MAGRFLLLRQHDAAVAGKPGTELHNGVDPEQFAGARAPGRSQRYNGRLAARLLFPLLVCAVAESQTKEVPWTQWGGPNRNFETEASGLAEKWPVGGPHTLWKRALGEGYSSILVENGVLYTMYGRPGEEVALGANAATGKTIWERSNPVRFRNESSGMGNGPHATPLLVGDRLFTVGVMGRLECLDKNTGKLLWTQALYEQQGGSPLVYGYASSPLAYRDMVLLLLAGRAGQWPPFARLMGRWSGRKMTPETLTLRLCSSMWTVSIR